jgi:hypothetical protein
MSERDNIPVLASIAKHTSVMEGAKVSISEILNVPLVFTGWQMGNSKFEKDGKRAARLTLQFEQNGQKKIVFTSSEVLIEQLKSFLEAMPDATCFRATIRRVDNKFFKFVE